MMDGNSLGLLSDTLQNAASQDPATFKGAELKLQSWEYQQGFYTALLRFASRLEFNTNARYMAVLYLKNGIERNWRRGTSSSISDQDKADIRTALKELIFVEPTLPIAIHLAVTIGKIARLDVPKEWPDLLPTLMEAVRSVEPERQLRALLTSYQVVKILSTKRLTGDRKLFQDIATEIFDYLCTLWDTLFMQWATAPTDPATVLQRAHLTLKILRVLVIRGYNCPTDSPSVNKFIPIVMTRAKEVLLLRMTRQDSSTLLEKHVTTMWKIIGDLLETHPFSFVPFLQGALEFSAYFGFSEEGQRLVFERVTIHTLNLLKGIVLCPEFIAPKNLDNDEEITSNRGDRCWTRVPSTETNPLTYEAAKIKKAFFTNATLNIMIRVLVTQYLPLNSTELELWSDEPEEFALRMEDSGEVWKYNKRQSAETLLVTFFKEYRETCVEILLPILAEFEAPLQDPNDRNRIIAKDSLYNAIGITAYELYDEFSFDNWLHSTLVPELGFPVPILHRRITWLVGQWTGVKITAESRPTIFGLLLNGLKSTDVVVRLSSSQALRSCLDDFDFMPEQFLPFIQEIFFLLFHLLKDVKESDNKMRVLNTMGFIIERMAPHIKSTIQLTNLTQYLPLLWNTEHNMLKAAVVSTSIQLVQALGKDAIALKDFLFPVIKISTDLKTPEHVYLLEDALELWKSLMEDTPDPPDEGFVLLVDNLIPLLTSSTEYLKTALTLVQSYCLIYPESFIQRFGSLICEELNTACKDMRAEGITIVLRTIEIMIKTSPNATPIAIKSFLRQIFNAVYENMEPPQLTSLYLSLISRIFITSEATFQYGLSDLATNEQIPIETTLAKLLEIMCTRVLDMVQIERRKLISIALLKLMSTGEQIVLHHICGIFLAIAETLNDITKTDASNGKVIDSLHLLDPNSLSSSDSSSNDSEDTTEIDLRKKRMSCRDVVYTVDLIGLFKNEVNNLRIKLGPTVFNDVISTVDVETMAMAKTYLE